jgi:hypothetical protein
MEQGFDVGTGSIAIGDPAMGLVTFDLGLLTGRYHCNRGALREPTDKDTQRIRLDGPFVFIVDSAKKDQFLEWYHRTFRECGFVIPMVAMRLGEATTELGVQVGFYWEEMLAGKSREGTYALDRTMISGGIEPTNGGGCRVNVVRVSLF